ncbi:Retrotransposon gag protein [Quillaja saponaria]|uniref:Retrotransposon gag protein n=1 Tax=Quillaja saponaria TaxID=32244 RepID=A0AAD7VDN7_QUISA|nr:Retrotransposon gag protein [Quillaja saponaria]
MKNREEEFEEQRRSRMGKGVEGVSSPALIPDLNTPVTQKQFAEIMTALGKISAKRVERAEPKVEDSVEHTEARHPFTKSVTNCLIPQGVKIPALEQYHRTSDPDDFVIGFESLMLLHGVPDQVICRAFGSTLRGSARWWFAQLKQDSIHSFGQLVSQFKRQFMTNRRHKKDATYLLSLKQDDEEPLKQFVGCFNCAALEVDDVNPQVVIIALRAGLKKSEFRNSLNKRTLKTLEELMKRAE